VFASVLDPDYPGHVILEQFQAQVKGFCFIINYSKENISSLQHIINVIGY